MSDTTKQATPTLVEQPRCIHLRDHGGPCQLHESDLIHAIPGTVAYSTPTPRQLELIGEFDTHPFMSTTTEPRDEQDDYFDLFIRAVNIDVREQERGSREQSIANAISSLVARTVNRLGYAVLPAGELERLRDAWGLNLSRYSWISREAERFGFSRHISRPPEAFITDGIERQAALIEEIRKACDLQPANSAVRAALARYDETKGARLIPADSDHVCSSCDRCEYCGKRACRGECANGAST